MRRNYALFVVIATVVAGHVAFSTFTYHVSDIKIFVFVAGLAALLTALTAQSAWTGLRGAIEGTLHRSLFAGLAAFVLLSVLSIAWAGYREAAVFRATEVVLYAAWAVGIFLALRTRRDVRDAMSAFLVAGIASAAIAFAFWLPYAFNHAVYREHSLWLDHASRQFFLPMGNSNWLAVAMLIPMMLCVAGFFRSAFSSPRNPTKAALYAGGFLLMAATVVKAGSHSSVVAFAVMLVALPVLAGAKRKWLIAGGIACALLLACALDLSRGRSSSVRNFVHSKSVAIRMDMWRWGLTLAKRNPVSGLGAGAYFPNVGAVAAPDFDARPGYFADIEVHAHNEFLETLTELGVFGLIAFLWPVGTALWGVCRRARDSIDPASRLHLAAFAAGWAAILLQSSLDVGMRFDNVPLAFWTGLGILAAALRAGEDAPAADETVAGKPASMSAVLGVGIPAAAVACIIIVTGLRGAAAMRLAGVETDPIEQVTLLRTASTCDLSFVDRVRATNELGRKLLESGSPGRAGDVFRRVLGEAGFYHDTQRLLAVTCFQRDQLDCAVRALRAYSDLRPADPRSADMLVSWIRLGGDPAQAMARAAKLVRDYPDFSKVYVAAGLLAMQFDPPDTASARMNFERALAANTCDPQALWLVGLDRLNAQKYVEARRLIEEAWTHGARSVELVVNLSRLRAMLGDTDGARRVLLDGAQLFPDSKRIQDEIRALPKAGD